MGFSLRFLGDIGKALFGGVARILGASGDYEAPAVTPIPKAPDPVPTAPDEAAAKAEAEEAALLAGKSKRRKYLLSQQAGEDDVSSMSVGRKRLLGE